MKTRGLREKNVRRKMKLEEGYGFFGRNFHTER
jgi:hypothetical protein